MFVINKLLIIKIILNLLIISNNIFLIDCFEHNNRSDSGSTQVFNRVYVIGNGKKAAKNNFNPIYIYSNSLSESKTNTIGHIIDVQHKKLNAYNNQLFEKYNNDYSVNSNYSINDDTVLKNLDIDTLIAILHNDNHTITSLLLDYLFDYDNAISNVNKNNHDNDSSSSEINYFTVYDVEEGRGRGNRRASQQRTKHIKVKKKYKKFLLPLLLAYKLKFFALIPIVISGLLLLTGSTGLAGFFFALFTATMGLKGKRQW